MADNKEIIDLLIDNAMTYGNMFDGLIKATMSGLDKLGAAQHQSKDIYKFFVCVRLRETIKLADNELTKKINQHLFRIIMNDGYVARVHNYFNEMNAMPIADFEAVFC